MPLFFRNVVSTYIFFEKVLDSVSVGQIHTSSDIWLMRACDLTLGSWDILEDAIWNVNGGTRNKDDVMIRAWYERSIDSHELRLLNAKNGTSLYEVTRPLIYDMPILGLRPGPTMLARDRWLNDYAKAYTPIYRQPRFRRPSFSFRPVISWWDKFAITAEMLALYLPYKSRLLVKDRIYPSLWLPGAAAYVQNRRWQLQSWTYLSTPELDIIKLYDDREYHVLYIAHCELGYFQKKSDANGAVDIFALSLLSGFVINDIPQKPYWLRVGVIL
jgi:hypothetical protein